MSETAEAGSTSTEDKLPIEGQSMKVLSWAFVLIVIVSLIQGFLDGRYTIKTSYTIDMTYGALLGLVFFSFVYSFIETRVLSKTSTALAPIKSVLRTTMIIVIIASIFLDGVEWWWMIIFAIGGGALSWGANFASQRFVSPAYEGRLAELSPGEWGSAFRIARNSADYKRRISGLGGLKKEFEQKAEKLSGILTVKISLEELVKKHKELGKVNTTPIQLVVLGKDGEDIHPEIKAHEQEKDKKEVRSVVSKGAQNALLRFAPYLEHFEERAGHFDAAAERSNEKIKALVANLEDLIIKGGETAAQVYLAARELKNMREKPLLARATFQMDKKPKSIYKMLKKGPRLSSRPEMREAIEKLNTVIQIVDWLVNDVLKQGDAKLSVTIQMVNIAGTLDRIARGRTWAQAISDVKTKIESYHDEISGWGGDVDEVGNGNDIKAHYNGLIVEPVTDRKDRSNLDPTNPITPLDEVKETAGIKWSPEVLRNLKS